MGIRSNKILSTIFLVLILTVTVSITMTPSAKAATVEPGVTSVDVSPDPVAVYHTVEFEWNIWPDPPSGYFYGGILLYVVMPDETEIFLGPFMSNEFGEVSCLFTPAQVGTYSATLSYPGEVLGEDNYTSFNAGPIYFDVVAYIPPVHNLDTGLNYSTIQSAIDAPETLAGHTIFVDNGTYYENVVVTKSIALIGEDSSNTIIDGGGSVSPVVNVTNVNNVEISGFTIQNGDYGFYLSGSSNTTVSGNTITNNGYPSTLYGVHYGGIYLSSSSSNTISENNIRYNYYGVIIDGSSNFNTISGNNITNNNYVAIRLSYSSNNILENNIIDDNQYSLVVYSYTLSHVTHNIDTSNTVDGKPIIYWINEQDKTVPFDAGYVGLVECMNITVQNLNLANNGQGVLLAYTTNSKITQNNIINNLDGIFLDNSYDNSISGNIITDNSRGIFIYKSSNNTAYGNTITDNDSGVGVWQSSSFNAVSGNNVTNNGEGITIVQESNNNTVSKNTLTNNEYSGIRIASSSNYNTISRNNVTNHEYGVIVDLYSNHTTVYGNTITDNDLGIHIGDSSDNWVFHNNFIDNLYQQFLSEAISMLDDGKEGNYWSDYNGTDSDGDGIGDTPYVIDENNQDNYPLMAPIYLWDAGTWEQTQYFVDCISNSTVSGFYFDPTEGALLRFNVEGESGTSGFCRVTIPKELLHSEGNWIVLVDGASVTPTVNEDANNTYLYFTYQHSTKTIEIRGTTVIPEFQSWALILFTLTALAAAVAIYITNTPKN